MINIYPKPAGFWSLGLLDGVGRESSRPMSAETSYGEGPPGVLKMSSEKWVC
jgi:hypothetical protein